MKKWLFNGYEASVIARKLHITPQSMRNKLSGKTDFTLFEMIQICEQFGLSYEEFVDELKLLREDIK